MKTDIKKKVNTYEHDKRCHVCFKGLMRPTGVCYTSDPPIYPHVCNKCGATENFQVMYPYIEHE